MCSQCWTEAGSPIERTDQTQRVVDLIEDLYASHVTGGPLHSAIDDWNVDETIAPYYDGTEWDAETRALCDEIAALLNEMTVPQRYAALAYSTGLAEQGIDP